MSHRSYFRPTALLLVHALTWSIVNTELHYCESYYLTSRSVPFSRLRRQIYLASVESASDDDDTNARSLFGTKVYWDELYQGLGDFPADEYQWYYGFDEYGKYVTSNIPYTSKILLPGVGNDPVVSELLQKGYTKLTCIDYSEHAIERQRDLLSYGYESIDSVLLQCMDARAMPQNWNATFDAIVEKGALDAIYLSGDGQLEATVHEFERVLTPGGILVSVSGVVPADLRKSVFKNWQLIRDGSDDLKAGIFVLQHP
jgi:SAM-dependent methyltransferase